MKEKRKNQASKTISALIDINIIAGIDLHYYHFTKVTSSEVYKLRAHQTSSP